MAGKSVIIIGAGLAGLSTGCYAQMNGYQSHIFEHTSAPGGVAATWKRKDYVIDGGIHFVMGHKPGAALHELYRELGVAQAERFVDMTTYGRFIDEANGISVQFSQDLNHLASDLKASSPIDAILIDELISGARGLQGLDLSTVGMSKPPELVTALDRLKEMWQMRRLFRYFSGKYSRPIVEYVKTVQAPWLKECIKNLFLPEVPVWFIFMILAAVADGQVAYLTGGCSDFVLGIEKRYRELGGHVTYKSTVKEILGENNRAVGVRLADGSEHRANYVISTGDGYCTIFKLLGGRYVDEKIKYRYANWKLSRPLIMVNYGVAREFPGEPPFTTIFLENPLKVGDQTILGIFVRIFNYCPSFAPAGKTVVQVEFETEWDYWNTLQSENRAAYDAEKERIAAELLKRLDRYYPGIASLVEMTDVATPYTTWRYTMNQKGAWGGWLMTPRLFTERIERTLPGLSNFYMAGQWVMPGGVPTSLYSGCHAIQLLCHYDRKPFSANLLAIV